MTSTAVQITSRLGPGDERTLAEDVLDGLTRPAKELPSKHFYDARGSELFERITDVPEYYPTRTERALLHKHATEIVAAVRPSELVELGSGSATKSRVLLDAMAEAGLLERYVPVDVSESAVRESAEQLVDEYPGLRVHGIIGDFERHLGELPPRIGGARLVAFLGGTIGNFPPGSRRRFLRSIASAMEPGDRLLLGTGLVADPETVRRAYDDGEGITAEFNRNVLRVLNRELGAAFDPGAFEHVALFDGQQEWIEMRLRALRPVTAHVAALGLDVVFAPGEELRTEISAKFRREGVAADLDAAGLRLEHWYEDPKGLFALSLACRADDGPRLD
jgi:L-histidine Nalpha-methyltransferase